MRDSPNSPRQHLVIPQLRFFPAAGDQNLRAGMIKRHQHAPLPTMNPARVFLQIQFMIVNLFQGIKRHPAKRHNYLRIDQSDCAAQEAGAVADLARAGPAVRAGWFARIAQRGAGDEDFSARQTDRRKKALEVLSRLIS